ncbi:hypothetical protein LI064_02320 [Clostridium perfringens]|uniref:hypothetical protein n=1 Tax=Clostridium perfringens TaxID=1502 RepID=UPI002245B4E5|nr:hypothetical protein [Clostridium perfringens]MCX0353357.1 hypothetical protein [Clostridium perfringens]
MRYKFIDLKEKDNFCAMYESGKLEKGVYIVENLYDYIVVDNLSGFYDIQFFRTLKGCKKYISEEMTAAEVILWEQDRAIRQEKLTYIVFYLVIFSMVGLLLYLIKI